MCMRGCCSPSCSMWVQLSGGNGFALDAFFGFGGCFNFDSVVYVYVKGIQA